MSKSFLICGLLMALTACATSQPSSTASTASAAAPAMAANTAAAPAASTAAAPAKPAKPKLVCEDSARIDSHFKQHLCYTPEEMEARRKAAQAAMQTYQNSSVSACGDSGCSGSTPPR